MVFGKIFNDSVNEYGKKFMSILKVFLFLYLIPVIVFMITIVILVIVLGGINLSDLPINNLSLASVTGFATSEIGSISPTFLIIFIPVVIILFLAFFYFMILRSISLVVISLSKKELSFKQVFKKARKYFWVYLGLVIVQMIFLLGLSVLLIIPGLIFLIYWMFSNYVLINENKGVMDSLKRSKQIVEGRWWRTFGYLLLVWIIIIGISIVFDWIPFVGGIVQQLVLIPFLILFLKNFYLDLKKNSIKRKKKK